MADQPQINRTELAKRLAPLVKDMTEGFWDKLPADVQHQILDVLSRRAAAIGEEHRIAFASVVASDPSDPRLIHAWLTVELSAALAVLFSEGRLPR